MTYRELFWMSESRLRAEWTQTSSIIRANYLAMCGKEPPLPPFIPERFRPKFAKPKAVAMTPEGRRQVVGAFIDVLHGRRPGGTK
jgi:hypothetical protein